MNYISTLAIFLVYFPRIFDKVLSNMQRWMLYNNHKKNQRTTNRLILSQIVLFISLDKLLETFTLNNTPIQRKTTKHLNIRVIILKIFHFGDKNIT